MVTDYPGACCCFFDFLGKEFPEIYQVNLFYNNNIDLII